MILFTYCKSCKEEIKIKSGASTRPDLAMDKGDEFNVNCQNCGKIQKNHVNDIKAKQNNIIVLAGVAIGIIITAVLWNVLSAIAVVSFAIPLLIWKQQSDSAHAFNSYRGQRK